LQHCKIDHFFRAIAARDDVARGKPHPDVHLRALGCEARDCLILEDFVQRRPGGACDRAMVIMVPDVLAPTPETEALCTPVAADLHQAGEIIRASPAIPDWKN